MADFMFQYVLARGDDEFLLEVTYEGSAYRANRWSDAEYYASIASVTLGDEEFPLTEQEENAILQACYDRLDDDLEDEENSYGDYVYEMKRDYEE